MSGVIDWNFPTIIELFLIQSIASSEGFSKVFKNSSMLLQQTRLYYLQQSCVNQSFFIKKKKTISEDVEKNWT